MQWASFSEYSIVPPNQGYSGEAHSSPTREEASYESFTHQGVFPIHKFGAISSSALDWDTGVLGCTPGSFIEQSQALPGEGAQAWMRQPATGMAPASRSSQSDSSPSAVKSRESLPGVPGTLPSGVLSSLIVKDRHSWMLCCGALVSIHDALPAQSPRRRQQPQACNQSEWKKLRKGLYRRLRELTMTDA